MGQDKRGKQVDSKRARLTPETGIPSSFLPASLAQRFNASVNSNIRDTTNAISAGVNIHDKASAISANADATTVETGSLSRFLPATFAQCFKASVNNTIRDSADAISAEANIRDAAYAISAEADEVNIRDGSNAISAVAPSSIGLSEPTSLFSGSSSSLSY